MSSGGKIFVIHTKIKSEPAGVDKEFWGEGGWLVPQGCTINGNMPTKCCLLRIGTYMLISKTITLEIPTMPQSRTCK